MGKHVQMGKPGVGLQTTPRSRLREQLGYAGQYNSVVNMGTRENIDLPEAIVSALSASASLQCLGSSCIVAQPKTGPTSLVPGPAAQFSAVHPFVRPEATGRVAATIAALWPQLLHICCIPAMC